MSRGWWGRQAASLNYASTIAFVAWPFKRLRRVENLPGMVVAISRTPMAFVNVISFSTPIQDRADLVERCQRAIRIGTESGVSWLLSTCDAWMGDPEVAKATLAEMNFSTALPTIGMVTDTILPPSKPLPEGLELKRVTDEETRNALADLNAVSYGLPQEIGRQGPARACFWDDSFHAYVAYLEGVPVSCAMTAPVDGLLHATPAGQPVYEAMGYRSVVGFTWYAL